MSMQNAGRNSNKELRKIIDTLARRRHGWQAFQDFVEVSAIAISNRVDRVHREAREARYMDIIGRYEKEEASMLAQALAWLVQNLEDETNDCLGKLFMELELHSHWHGQYFSPWPIASMMARLTLADSEHLLQKEFITVHEPAAGSGVMVMAFAQALRDMGINYQQRMHAHVVDVEQTAVHMAYVQLSLMNIPALVIHGNSLSLQEWSVWATPAHILGGWAFKLRRRLKDAPAPNQVVDSVLENATGKEDLDPPKQPDVVFVEGNGQLRLL
jgi:hypothetical protein